MNGKEKLYLSGDKFGQTAFLPSGRCFNSSLEARKQEGGREGAKQTRHVMSCDAAATDRERGRREAGRAGGRANFNLIPPLHLGTAAAVYDEVMFLR